MSDLLYPHLKNCAIVATADISTDESPVSLPSEATDALNTHIPSPYDFSLEHDVLKRKSSQNSLIEELRNSSTELSNNGPLANRNATTHFAESLRSAPAASPVVVGMNFDHLSKVNKIKLEKMSSVTGASTSTCFDLLENNSYNLERSIEAYFRGER